MLALLFRHGVEFTIPGPTHVSREDAGDGAVERIPPLGAVGSPWGPPAPARSRGTIQLLPVSPSASRISMPSKVGGQMWD